MNMKMKIKTLIIVTLLMVSSTVISRPLYITNKYTFNKNVAWHLQVPQIKLGKGKALKRKKLKDYIIYGKGDVPKFKFLTTNNLLSAVYRTHMHFTKKFDTHKVIRFSLNYDGREQLTRILAGGFKWSTALFGDDTKVLDYTGPDKPGSTAIHLRAERVLRLGINNILKDEEFLVRPFKHHTLKGRKYSDRCISDFNLKLKSLHITYSEEGKEVPSTRFIVVYYDDKLLWYSEDHTYNWYLKKLCVSRKRAIIQSKSKHRMLQKLTRTRMLNGWKPKKLPPKKPTKRQSRCAKFESGLLTNIENFKRANPKKSRSRLAYEMVMGGGVSSTIRSCKVGKYRFKSSILRTAINKARIARKKGKGGRKGRR